MEELQDTAAGRWQLPQSAAAIFLPCMVQRMIGEARGIMVIVASGGLIFALEWTAEKRKSEEYFCVGPPENIRYTNSYV